MKLDIYLENQRLDIDTDTQLALTYRFSDLTNPATQTGDYSTTFTIKGTQNNNAIFGQIWRLDRVTLLGGELNTSIYFNASKRTNCVIYINHEVFKRGYVKLNTIKSVKGVISYDVTFYSELVDVLRTLKESKLRDLPFPNDLRHTLNADNIGAFWTKNSENAQVAPLLPYFAYIMANNGIYDEFESDKWLTMKNGKYAVESVLNEIQLDECAKREYRSYYQRPALRLKGLIDLIASEHGIQLDPAFFNDDNPYYADSVMALPQYNIMEQTKDYTGLAQYGEDGTDNVLTISAASNNGIIVPSFKSDDGGGILPSTWSDAIDFSAVSTSKSEISIELEYTIIAHLKTELPDRASVSLFFVPNSTYISEGIYPTLDLMSEGRSYPMTRNIGADKYHAVKNANGRYNAALYFLKEVGEDRKVATLTINNIYNGLYTGYKGNGRNKVPIRFTLNAREFLNIASIDARIESISKTATGGEIFPATLIYQYYNAGTQTGTVEVDYYEVRLYPITKAPAEGGDLNQYFPVSAGFTGNDITVGLDKKIRSGYTVDKSDIIDDETTQGDFLINYAKLFGLLFYTDKDGTPRLVTRNTFFKDYKIEDWTHKIDHAKEIQQVPIPFDTKYLLMRYQDGETYYEDYYKTQYDTEYGGQRINTGFEFDENETDLIADNPFYNTVMSKERTRMLIGTKYLVDNDPKTLPAMFQKEDGGRTPSDTKFNLLFDNGMVDIDSATKSIYLTDDNLKMLDENEEVNGGKYCWLDVATVPINGTTDTFYQPRNQYPQYSTLHKSGAFSWHIGYPLENYAGWLRSDFPESSTIYANFWRNYIAEIYDVDNRIMTAYVRLTAADIAQFSFGNFVKIGDALWHVNKIDQFNPLGDGTTKVEFLRVSSLAAIENAYKNGQTDMSAVVPPVPFPPMLFNVTIDLTHVASSEPNTTVEEGDSFTTTLTADSGYQFKSVTVVMRGEDITAQVFTATNRNTKGTISIPSVTGDVTITAVGELIPIVTYKVALQLTDVSSDKDDMTVERGDTFTAILDTAVGYRIDSIVVEMGGVDITSQTIGGVKVWQPNPNNKRGTVTIAGVTGNVNIVATGEIAEYEVVLQLTNVQSNQDDQSVENGSAFTATLTAEDGYRIDNIVITMGGDDITAMEIGGVRVWQPNADKTSGRITIPAVTADVNIVASATQIQPANYRTIKVYSDIDGVIVESNGVQYKNLSMDTPAEVKVYYGDGVSDGITVDYSQAGNLPGTPVLIYGLPKPVSGPTVIQTWDTIVDPSRIDQSGAFYEYDDTDGDMEFNEGKTYVITALPAIGTAKGIVVQNLVRQTVASYNGKAWTNILNNVTAGSANMEIPADSIAVQFYGMGEREFLDVDSQSFAFDGLGDGIVVPSYYLRDKNTIVCGEI